MVPSLFGQRYSTNVKFSLPQWNALYESEFQWRQQARDSFEKYLDNWSANFRTDLKREIESGRLTAIPKPRGDTPLELRYEWAARRYCLRQGWKEMSSNQHSAEKIRKIAGPILIDLGLVEKKKRK